MGYFQNRASPVRLHQQVCGGEFKKKRIFFRQHNPHHIRKQYLNYQSVVGVGHFHPAYRPYDEFDEEDDSSENDMDSTQQQQRMDQSNHLNDQPEKSFDPALFDVTKIPVDDFANQITIDDFEIFKRITPDEVSFSHSISDHQPQIRPK